MVDACTYMENGELYINYEQLSGLLSRMYVEVDGSYWGGVNQPDAMIEGRMKYETSAILELLNGYRTAIGNNITNKYGYYMYIDQTDSSLNTEEIKYARSVLNTETTISDLIFALCENGDISVSLGYPNSVRGEAERKSLELSISELESGDISITSNGTGCEAVIYTISGSLREECVEADNRWFLAQLVNPWEKLVFDVAASGFDSAVGAVPVVGNIYGYIKDGYGIYQSFDENKKNNENLHTVVRNNNLQLYLESMHCGGTVVSLGDTYVVRNLIVDKNALTVDVAFYNAHNKDADLTPNMLMNELNNYIEGKEDCDNLVAFCGYGNGDEDVNGSLLAAHDNYEHNVCQYLIEEYNVYTSEATAEQLEEAINAVDDGWTAVNNN